MDESGFLASAHRRVVDESIRAVLDEVACDMGDLERNIVGIALRQEVETRLVPELLALHALLLGANAKMLGRLPGWLDRVQTQLPGDAEFLTEMGCYWTPMLSGYWKRTLCCCQGSRRRPGHSPTFSGRWLPGFPSVLR